MKLADVLTDFALVSVLLVVSYLIRSKVKLLQKVFLPTSIIAGILGLLLGPQILGKFSPVSLTYTSVNQWAGVLVVVVVSTSFLSLSVKGVSGDAFATTMLTGSIHQAQIVAPLAIGALLMPVVPGLVYGFGLLPVFGFYGGHGMAAQCGTIYSDIGYMADSMDVCVTFATVGLLCGIIGGMIIINIGARRGTTKIKMKFEDMSVAERIGYIEEKDRKPVGMAVTANGVIDPMAWQLAIVGVIILIGTYVRNGIIKVFPVMKNFPLVSVCILLSLGIGILSNKGNNVFAKVIDKGCMKRIGGVAMDYMITASIISTNTTVFAKYLLPIVLMSVACIGLSILIAFGLGKRWLKDNWFETAVGSFGQTMGVLATGLTLIKVVDPENNTTAAQCISASSTFGFSWQIPYLVIGLAVMPSHPVAVTVVSVALLFAFLIAGEVQYRKRKKQA